VKVLVVGSGGREHALLWAIRREHPEARLWCAPGNAGTAQLATNLPIPALAIVDLVGTAGQLGIDLTIIGPEAPLAEGLADQLRAAGRLAFGPSAQAARIEASKAWAKDVMRSAGVPTAASATFTDLREALHHVDRHAEPLVVKASGLAAGKGAVVCPTRADARAAVRAMLEDDALGSAGGTIVIEDFLTGEELSVLALTNGRDIQMLPAAQDHKRLREGDEGPNTGGMGAYSPVAIATPALLATIERRILEPTLTELARRGAPFSGVLYAGLMIGPSGEPSVIEFNCRFGDPETQAILPRMEGGVLDALHDCAAGRPVRAPRVGAAAAVTTVLAARGYPERAEKGAAIAIPALPDDTIVFHAGTRSDADGTLRVDGGRVLAVTGVAPEFDTAREKSRRAAGAIRFEGKQFRADIGWREAARASR
jgi:phosphoribosylamine--glycine ligase